MNIYLAGPMTGHPDFNFPAFRAAAQTLRGWGHCVWSPAEQDEAEDGFDPKTGQGLQTHRHYMIRDLPALLAGDAVALLPGWTTSKGARLEAAVASECGLDVFEFDPTGLRPIALEPLAYTAGPQPPAEPIGVGASAPVTMTPGSNEVRVTSSTGGQKGEKPERYDLLPVAELAEVARLYGQAGGPPGGPPKYEERNWERGYPWHLSYSSARRHLDAFWAGQSTDPDSGRHHLAAVVFHALALMRFEKAHPAFDDRPGT